MIVIIALIVLYAVFLWNRRAGFKLGKSLSLLWGITLGAVGISTVYWCGQVLQAGGEVGFSVAALALLAAAACIASAFRHQPRALLAVPPLVMAAAALNWFAGLVWADQTGGGFSGMTYSNMTLLLTAVLLLLTPFSGKFTDGVGLPYTASP